VIEEVIVSVLFEESRGLLQEAAFDIERVSDEATDLRHRIAGVGYWNWEGMSYHDSIEDLRLTANAAACAAETKLDQVASIVENARFSADEANELIRQKAAIQAANGALGRDLDELNRHAQDCNIFAAIRGVWEDVRAFTRRIATKLIRVTITATRQISAGVRGLLE
jgi:hypothetical protein